MSDSMPAVGANLRPASPDTETVRAPAPPRPSTLPFRVVDDAARLLRRLFRSFDGTLALRLWDGTNLTVGKSIPD